MIKLSTIKFSELSNYNNWNSIVMMGIYPLNESDINDVCEFFEKEMKLFEDSKVIEIKRIVSDENPVINNRCILFSICYTAFFIFFLLQKDLTGNKILPTAL